MNLIVIWVSKHIYFFTILYQVLTPVLGCYTQAVVDISGFEACLYPSFSNTRIFVPKNINGFCSAKCNKHTALPGVVKRVVQAIVPTPLSCLFFVLKNSPVLHDPKTAISIQCSGVEDLTVLFKRCLHPIILVA